LEGNVHDQDTPPNGELAMLGPHGMPIIPISLLDHGPPCSILIEFQALVSHYIHQAWHALPSPNPQSFMNLGNGPLGLNPLDTKVI